MINYNPHMVYDSIVIGGGPAGLSAAIYLARFNRSVLVIDKHKGRSTYPQVNDNYLGFPDGIKAQDLRLLGRKQAKKFGAEFCTDEIQDIKKLNDIFYCKGNLGYKAKTIILATGVIDRFPQFPGWKQYVGKSLFWCITCDGYKTRDKRIVVIGRNDDAAITCLQFLNYTKKLAFVTNCFEGDVELSDEVLQRLQRAKIPCYVSCLVKVYGNNGRMNYIELTDGTTLELDFMFNQQGSAPKSHLAECLNVALDKNGFIKTDMEQRTNIPFVYAAGDVTKNFAHQIVTAAHEGAMAGQAVNYDLYEEFQR